MHRTLRRCAGGYSSTIAGTRLTRPGVRQAEVNDPALAATSAARRRASGRLTPQAGSSIRHRVPGAGPARDACDRPQRPNRPATNRAHHGSRSPAPGSARERQPLPSLNPVAHQKTRAYRHRARLVPPRVEEDRAGPSALAARVAKALAAELDGRRHLARLD